MNELECAYCLFDGVDPVPLAETIWKGTALCRKHLLSLPMLIRHH